MKEWLLSIVAGVIITILVVSILPNGKSTKTIKSILSCLIAIIIIKPIFNINLENFNLFDFFEPKEIVLDKDYLDFFYSKSKNEQEIYCAKLIENIGIKDSIVKIECDSSNEIYLIKSVSVNIKNSVINQELEHIDIIEKIKDNLSTYLQVDKKIINVIR